MGLEFVPHFSSEPAVLEPACLNNIIIIVIIIFKFFINFRYISKQIFVEFILFVLF